MIVYHIDKCRVLQQGQVIQPSSFLESLNPARRVYVNALETLFPGNVQPFGIQALGPIEGKDRIVEASELILDYVRALLFPHLPSRFTVLYASRSLEAARKWLPVVAFEDHQPQCVAITPMDKVYCADATHRDELYHRMKRLFVASGENPANGWDVHRMLSAAVPPAQAYWETVQELHQPFADSPSYAREELLILPPLRVEEVLR